MKKHLFLLMCAVMAATMTFAAQQGSKGGRFSVASGVQVRFAQGNLQYHVRNHVWQFATRQDSVIGESNEGRITENYNGWIDLFGWGTSGYNNKMPYMYSRTNSEYAFGDKTDIAGTNYDWGVYCAISNGGNQAGLWRTLTKAEWMYMLNNRTDAPLLHGFGSVNGLRGFILLPDGWALPVGGHFTSVGTNRAQNAYTLDEWAIMEAAGAVFLPDAGYATPKSNGTVEWSGPSSSRGNIGVMESSYVSSTANTASSCSCFKLSYNLSSYDSETNLVKNANSSSFYMENPVRLAYTIVDYDVVFKNWDGTVLASQPVEVGSPATPPTPPDRSGYTFTGWSSSVTGMTPACITGPVTFTAQYEERVTYTVRFIDPYDGTVLKTEYVDPNGAATAPAEPSHTGGYTFLRWDKAFNNITANTDVNALYQYGLRIAGTRVTDDNLSTLGSLTGVTVNTGGYLIFEPATRTLKMKDLTITTSNVTWAIFTQIPNLLIEVSGTCDLNTPYCIAFRSDNNTSIVGIDNSALLKVRNAGPLPSGVEGGTAGMCYAALTTFNNSSLTISDCNVQVEGAGGIYIQGSSQLILTRVHLTTKVVGTPTGDKQREVMLSFRANVAPILSYCEPLAPEGVTYSSELKGYTVDGFNLTTEQVEIGQPPCSAKTSEFTQTACDFYTWNDQTYTTSGNYDQTFVMQNGCDSVVTLHLTVNQSKASEFSETATSSYTWNGQTYVMSGDYRQTFSAANGCDSVVTLHLTITTPVTNYFVAGNGSAGNPWCDGKFWDPAGSLIQDGSITFHNVPVGTYEFKITNGDWQSGGGSEWAFGAVDASCSSANVANGGSDANGNIKLITSVKQDIKIEFDGTRICVIGTFVDPSTVVVSDYTVVGSEELLGAFWDLYAQANDMTLAEPGIFKLTKNNIALEAGVVYQYKVVGGHNYSIFQWPSESQNNELVVEEDGDYDVVFTFNRNTNPYTLTAVATKVKVIPEEVPTDMTSWPNGKLPGRFTINSDGYQVQFSQGNLQYKPSEDKWRFATSMKAADGSTRFYEGDANINITDPSYEGWLDLFGWGTGNNPTLASANLADYGAFADWGINPIINGGNLPNIWRTLSKDEWHFLLFERLNADKLKKVVTVGGESWLVLLPDNWERPTDVTETQMPDIYDIDAIVADADWDYLENLGWVFLPAAGYRSFAETGGAKTFSAYWSSNTAGSERAYFAYFRSDPTIDVNNYLRSTGYSVRLVRDVMNCVDRSYDIYETVPGTSYTWNGETYSASGEYVQIFFDKTGCDSIVTLHLTLTDCNTIYHNFEEVVIADSYTWNSQTYALGGDYEQTFTLPNGCDSVARLHLFLYNYEISYPTSMGGLINIWNELGLAEGEVSKYAYMARGYVTQWVDGYPDFQNADFFIDDTKDSEETIFECFRLKASYDEDKTKLNKGDLVEAIGYLKNQYSKPQLVNGIFRVIERNEDQAIDGVNATGQYRKILLNNQLYILTPDGAMYNVIGIQNH
ncbi:MAG: InlB B-repeat-containing protein [Paludibacteraceae bacterium]|nr:InlB B-repeat-containing protein [Paludibacteraceae bacterium]